MTNHSDRNTFTKHVEKCHQMAYSLACRMVGEPDTAKDILQDSLIKAWQNFRTYNPERKFSTWFCAIVLNTCKDYLKKHRWLQYEQQVQDSDVLPPNQVEQDELNQQIMVYVQMLPGKQLDVFVLHDLQGMAQGEIETILELNKGAARQHLYLARKFLREKLMLLHNKEKENEQKVHR